MEKLFFLELSLQTRKFEVSIDLLLCREDIRQAETDEPNLSETEDSKQIKKGEFCLLDLLDEESTFYLGLIEVIDVLKSNSCPILDLQSR